VRLLLDQNLSRKLVEQLQIEFPNSAHVEALGLSLATDREIWDYAAQNDFVIVSKDSDFRQLAFLYGPPPKSIWLNVGNSSTLSILEILRINSDVIAQFGESIEESFMMLSGDVRAR